MKKGRKKHEECPLEKKPTPERLLAIDERRDYKAFRDGLKTWHGGGDSQGEQHETLAKEEFEFCKAYKTRSRSLPQVLR